MEELTYRTYWNGSRFIRVELVDPLPGCEVEVVDGVVRVWNLDLDAGIHQPGDWRSFDGWWIPISELEGLEATRLRQRLETVVPELAVGAVANILPALMAEQALLRRAG
jgi:hypothetical protein